MQTQSIVNKRRICPGISLVKYHTVKAVHHETKCNWLILHGYILEPSLNLFKAHIVLLMLTYVNTKAITLINFFVGFVQV